MLNICLTINNFKYIKAIKARQSINYLNLNDLNAKQKHFLAKNIDSIDSTLECIQCSQKCVTFETPAFYMIRI
jgi:hypothetical protein